MQAEPLREIFPGGTKTNAGIPSFWDLCRNMHILFV